jgi:hypothetical protein
MIIDPRNKLWLLLMRAQNSLHKKETEVTHMDAGKRCLVSTERGEVPIVPLIFT